MVNIIREEVKHRQPLSLLVVLQPLVKTDGEMEEFVPGSFEAQFQGVLAAPGRRQRHVKWFQEA